MPKIKPLAETLRPTNLSEVVGQQHILGQNKVLRQIIESGNISNMIFYGPSGTGKTTIANIAAKCSNRTFYKLNATTANLSDVREVTQSVGMLGNENGILLYLDEIQNFNKKQQQALLECIENGDVVLIASTTENPYFYVYNAILSRSNVFDFKPLQTSDIESALARGVEYIKQNSPTFNALPDAITHMAQMSGGDVRRALNSLELAHSVLPLGGDVTLEIAEQCTQKQAMTYDKLGDNHYDILSAFQKSIRGSDPNAALHYLARLLTAGDIQSPTRRMLVIAAEDIGLAYPNALPITKAAVDSAFQLGLPEAQIPLAEAVILLCMAPKSNSGVNAIHAAMADIASGHLGNIPEHLRDIHYEGGKLKKMSGYKYPHDFPNHYTPQQYLPDELIDAEYYTPAENKFEQELNDYWKKIK
ncbi:MAG: replication-associated recombination protein A [Clostridiales bacterium]|nr:replication-associated recombination protein A [Clostridiales bacterium]